jgi:hypothetical protein
VHSATAETPWREPKRLSSASNSYLREKERTKEKEKERKKERKKDEGERGRRRVGRLAYTSDTFYGIVCFLRTYTGFRLSFYTHTDPTR